MKDIIYDKILQCEKNMNLDFFNVDINNELCSLFNNISGIDLSKESNAFVKDGGDIVLGVNINYKFKYGYVTVKAYLPNISINLNVIFNIKKSYKSILKPQFISNVCYIDVNHDLSFIKAESLQIFFLSNNNSRLYLNSNFHITFTNSMTLYSNTKHLSFNDINTDYEEFHHDVDKRFYLADSNFDFSFIRFMKIFSYSQDIFYIGFPEYSIYKDIRKPKEIIKFINIFINDYFNNYNNLIEIINENYLLSEMESF